MTNTDYSPISIYISLSPWSTSCTYLESTFYPHTSTLPPPDFNSSPSTTHAESTTQLSSPSQLTLPFPFLVSVHSFSVTRPPPPTRKPMPLFPTHVTLFAVTTLFAFPAIVIPLPRPSAKLQSVSFTLQSWLTRSPLILDPEMTRLVPTNIVLLLLRWLQLRNMPTEQSVTWQARRLAQTFGMT